MRKIAIAYPKWTTIVSSDGEFIERRDDVYVRVPDQAGERDVFVTSTGEVIRASRREFIDEREAAQTDETPRRS